MTEKRRSAGSDCQNEEGRFCRPSLWLCLSGGGLRASLFHYGCFKRMHDLGLLAHVHSISATSGGAIVAGLADLHFCEGPLDKKTGVNLSSIDWEAFESDLLGLARRGMLGPVMALSWAYGLYAAGAIIAVFASHVTGALVLLTGLIVHARLCFALIRQRAHCPSEDALAFAKLGGAEYAGEWCTRSWRRLLKMLFVPSYLRLQTLNLRAYKGRLLALGNRFVKTYYTAVDLNSGREFVFTSGVVADLQRASCRALWEQRSDSREEASDRIELAEAVAASSAFPPIFKPLAVKNRERLLGVFVDGGVLDNLAINVPRALAVYIHPRYGPRYDKSKNERAKPCFQEEISHLLGFDGGAPPKRKRKASWSRLFTPRRLVSILAGQQFDFTDMVAWEMESHSGVGTDMLGLHLGFPSGHPLEDERLTRALRAIRTHLDSFSPEECAVIAYSGYMWVDYLARDGYWNRYHGVSYVPPVEFKDILPTYAGKWDPSIESLVKHLRYSHRRLAVLRWIGRRFGI